MPHPQKPRHPLVIVRKHTPYCTQRRLAEEVGVSEVAIRKIESGSLTLSRDLAQRISLATGVDPATIRNPDCSTPMSLAENAPYSEKSFAYWRSVQRNDVSDDPQTIIAYAEAIKELVEDVLFASAVGRHHKFQRVLWSICQSIAGIAENFGLQTALRSVCSGKAGPEDHEAYEKRKLEALLFRLHGEPNIPPAATLPPFAFEKDLDAILNEGVVLLARQQQDTIDTRTSILRELRSFSECATQHKSTKPKTKKAKSPKNLQPPSASPKRGSARTKSASRHDVPSQRR